MGGFRDLGHGIAKEVESAWRVLESEEGLAFE